MIKKICALTVILMLLIGCLPFRHSFADPDIKYLHRNAFHFRFNLKGNAELNGEDFELSNDLFIRSETLYMPLSDFVNIIKEYFSSLQYPFNNKIITNQFDVKISSSLKKLYLGKFKIDFAPQAVIHRGSVYIPVKSFCKLFGLKLIKLSNNYYMITNIHYDDDDDYLFPYPEFPYPIYNEINEIHFSNYQGTLKPNNIKVAGVEVRYLDSNRMLIFIKAGPRYNIDEELIVDEVAHSSYGLMISTSANYKNPDKIAYPYAAIVINKQYQQPIFWRLDEETINFKTIPNAKPKNPLRTSKPKAVIGTARSLLTNYNNPNDLIMIVYSGRVLQSGCTLEVNNISENSDIAVFATLHKPKLGSDKKPSYPYTVVKLLSDVDTDKEISVDVQIQQNNLIEKIDFTEYSGKLVGSVDLTTPGIDSFQDSQKRVIIVAKLGIKPTGGYSINIKNVYYNRQTKQIIVEAHYHKPKPNEPVTTAITFPYNAVRISRNYAGKDIEIVLTEK